MFKNATLLVTGGTGLFGHAVLRKFLRTNVREIRVFSRDEKKQDDMRKNFRDPKLRFYLGDVRDFGSVSSAMAGVDFVFHAAALKQVQGDERMLRQVDDYTTPNVSEKVVRIIHSYTDYVNRVVWRKD